MLRAQHTEPCAVCLGGGEVSQSALVQSMRNKGVGLWDIWEVSADRALNQAQPGAQHLLSISQAFLPGCSRAELTSGCLFPKLLSLSRKQIIGRNGFLLSS